MCVEEPATSDACPQFLCDQTLFLFFFSMKLLFLICFCLGNSVWDLGRTPFSPVQQIRELTHLTSRFPKENECLESATSGKFIELSPHNNIGNSSIGFKPPSFETSEAHIRHSHSRWKSNSLTERFPALNRLAQVIPQPWATKLNNKFREVFLHRVVGIVAVYERLVVTTLITGALAKPNRLRRFIRPFLSKRPKTAPKRRFHKKEVFFSTSDYRGHVESYRGFGSESFDRH